MASKNSTKFYAENTFYHLYNRGVEKRNIFLDEQDYSVLLSYLKTYLSPKDDNKLKSIITSSEKSLKEKDIAIKQLKLKNYSSSIELLCYALLPNHFHFLVKQVKPVMNSFMNSLGTRYSMYFNRKYKRTGVLFQDVYKGVLVENEQQLLYLSRYIHLNPVRYYNLKPGDWRKTNLPTSLPNYLNLSKISWLNSSFILDYFSKNNLANSYEAFLDLSLDLNPILKFAIDQEDD